MQKKIQYVTYILYLNTQLFTFCKAEQLIKEFGSSHQFHLGLEANFLSRTAFNHTALTSENSNAGDYPQDSFAYTSMKIFGNYTWNGLIVSAGYFGGVAYTYNGWYPFMDDQNVALRNGSAVEFHRFLFYRAFLGYDNESWFVRLGRFILEDDDWLKSSVQGGQVIYKNNNFLIKFFALSHLTTAFGAWVWDFRNGAIPTGIYHAALQYHTKSEKYEFRIRPFVYYVPNYYVIPGFNSHFFFHTQSNLTWHTYLVFSYEFYLQNANLATPLFPLVPLGNNAASLYISQELEFLQHYKVDIGFYKNFGHFNGILGMYGNPAGASIYDNSFFASLWLNDFLAKDSQSILLNFSTNIVKNTILGLFYRGTWNQRSIENIVGITASYDWTKNITFRAILAWYLDETKAGYNAKFWIPIAQVPESLRQGITNLNPNRNLADRSYLMFNIIAKI